MLTEAVETNAHGWLWPKGDVHTWPTVKQELAEIPDLVALCKQRRTCVQAGGNGGLWVKELAGLFQTVMTFEPDCINFRCLVHNVPHDNVIFTQAAVGKHRGFVDMDRWCGPQNPGANRVKGGGRIPVVRIDDYELPHVDLIQFDIEGFELNALEGAVATIERCQPVISVELRNHSHHYGTTDENIREWLRGKGYHMARRFHFDEFWVPNT